MKNLQIFSLPKNVTGSAADIALGKAMIDVWRSDGIFAVGTTPDQDEIADRAIASGKRFFKKSLPEKKMHISELTYSGYVAYAEEQTAGEPDFSEVFTVCKDVSLADERVKEQWPCHGPVPWPDKEYEESMLDFMGRFGGVVGEELLKLTALGLGLEINALTDLSVDGWHHMRVLRFPQATSEEDRGLGAHTDYGMLVIAVQRDAGGLDVDIRLPVNQNGEREKRNKNWLSGQSTAGENESDPNWWRISLVPGVFVVFPGDLLQYITGDYLVSTSHKVTLHKKIERFPIAYFHEPNFGCSVRPLLGENEPESFFYGKHFTDMFMRCYPERSTTQRIKKLNLCKNLESIRQTVPTKKS
ncbi:2OG-Fe(II) oxygenase family protein [Burkholderia ubonensis]|uniref:2OG-Fe(II) oxygenase family protein n=1 Tax=Burkholderia ubonensis TaxID=101571 RepID=UPI0009B45A87|nr:2OG-Fe(II) oxygenase family protein [Burkholderia ubonensis]